VQPHSEPTAVAETGGHWCRTAARCSSPGGRIWKSVISMPPLESAFGLAVTSKCNYYYYYY